MDNVTTHLYGEAVNVFLSLCNYNTHISLKEVYKKPSRGKQIVYNDLINGYDFCFIDKVISHTIISYNNQAFVLLRLIRVYDSAEGCYKYAIIKNTHKNRYAFIFNKSKFGRIIF